MNKDSHMNELAQYTTFGIGGPAKHLITAQTEAELVAAIAAADAKAEPVLVLSGGSNMLISDAGFDGTVIRVATKGIQTEDVQGCSGAFLNVAAGETFDDFVQYCLEQASQRQGFVGIEALSGIPGLVGAAPIQNIGAYGQEVADTIARVRTYDRGTKQIKTFAAADCNFGYRDSLFKQTPYLPVAADSATDVSAASRFSGTGRYIVLTVSFQLRLGKLSTPIQYAQLAEKLGIDVGGRVPLAQVREAVLELRRSKGMVLDAADRDTWSAGSFFTNPILTPEAAERLPAAAPRYPGAQGVKTSAAWLIEHAGFAKGFGDGLAAISSKHALALTNCGGAQASDVVRLARQIIATVYQRFGVQLRVEPVLVGIEI